MCPVYSVNDVTGLYRWAGTLSGCDLVTLTLPVVFAKLRPPAPLSQPFGLVNKKEAGNARL